MSLSKLNFKNKKKILYLLILLFFSILFNQYYGFLGLYPLDSLIFFNSGYEVLNGYFPFKDYWTLTGPFIDFIQALFFKMFGVSWFSYVFHASIFNFIFSASIFYTLYRFRLTVHYCFLYAFLVSIIAYPSSGTPYVDHQSSFLCVMAVFCFILALKTNLKKYWLILPIILGIAFLTKQAPTGYFILIISFLSFIYFTFNFDINKIIFFALGSFIFIFIFLAVVLINEIPLLSFFQQYFLYPIYIADSRVELFFPLELKRIFLRFKLHHLSLLILIIVSIKKIIENYKYLKNDEFLIIVALIGSTFALILHQLMTINGMFIFFLIPILTGFSHIYCLKNFKNKNYLTYLLIFLSIASTIHYWNKYIDKRDFVDLSKANLKNAVDAKILDNKLSGLKWLTPIYPNNPKEEILKLQEAINIIRNDIRNKIIATDYQFISVILSSYDYSPNKYWYKHHVYPEKGDKYFEIYRNFFVSKLKENKIEIVYTVEPLIGDDDVLEDILSKDCVKKTQVTDILVSHMLLNCEDLKN